MTTVNNDKKIMTPHIKKRQVEQPRTPGKNEPPTKRRKGELTPTKLAFNQPPDLASVAVTTGVADWVEEVWAAFVAAHGDGPK